MAEEFYDVIGEVKGYVNEPYTKYYELAKAASQEGKLKLVREETVQPYAGYGFELKKGQVVRYELTHGPQIIDTMYLVKSRPKDEWACIFHSGSFGALIIREGMHYWSNTPYVRPLLTLINDTVDYDKLFAEYGERAGHNFVYPSGRCNAGLLETINGIPHSNNCDGSMIQGIYEVAGEEIARSVKIPQAFMHFQMVDFERVPPNITYSPGLRFGDIFEKGDYVELLAHDDLYASFAMCPAGDQNSYNIGFRNQVCYPLKYAIYEGVDGPLETAPEPERESWDAVDWIKAGRPGMVTGVVGEEQF